MRPSLVSSQRKTALLLINLNIEDSDKSCALLYQKATTSEDEQGFWALNALIVKCAMVELTIKMSILKIEYIIFVLIMHFQSICNSREEFISYTSCNGQFVICIFIDIFEHSQMF